jgi:hypothetical protein
MDNRPCVIKQMLKSGEDYPAVVIYKLGDAVNNYMPSQEEINDFKELLEKQAADPKSSSLITHYGVAVELEYIPTWMIKLNTFIGYVAACVKTKLGFDRLWNCSGKKKEKP